MGLFVSFLVAKHPPTLVEKCFFDALVFHTSLLSKKV